MSTPVPHDPADPAGPFPEPGVDPDSAPTRTERRTSIPLRTCPVARRPPTRARADLTAFRPAPCTRPQPLHATEGGINDDDERVSTSSTCERWSPRWSIELRSASRSTCHPALSVA
jgi:hypothetical protein